MSVETAREFLAKIATDEGLAKSAAGLTGPALVTLAQRWGYAFTETQLAQAAADTQDSGQLSGNELDQVSGGLRSRGPYTG